MARTERAGRAASAAAGALCLVSMTAGFNACPTDPIGFCEARAKARCELAFRCCSAEERLTELPGNFGVGTYTNSEGECVDRLSALCAATDGERQDAIGLGREKFLGDVAQQCIDALNKARDACDINDFQAAEISDDCVKVTEGLVDDGDECARNEECADQGFCDIDFGDPDVDKETGSVAGECVAPSGEGGSCVAPHTCAEGLICDGQTCFAPGDDGEPCPQFACAAGLQCQFDEAQGQNICRRLPRGGEACPNFACDVGFICNGAQQVCEAAPPVGQPCPSGQCAAGAFCDRFDGTGTCQAQKDPGDTCDVSTGNQCKGELAFCDTSQEPPRCAIQGAPTPLDICKGNE